MSTRGDRIFFMQDDALIPSRIKSNLIRDTYEYEITSSLRTIRPTEIAALVDDLWESALEIDPIDAPRGFTLTLSFPQEIQKNTFTPVININTRKETLFEISKDGKQYVRVSQNDISTQSFSFLRISFPQENGTQSSVAIRTLRFDKANSDVYVVAPKNQDIITAYRWWSCSEGELFALQNKQESISKEIDINISSDNAVWLEFMPIPTTGHDSDSDGVIDMRDNCPNVVNHNQEDRNFDGIGDACSDDDNDGIKWSSDNCPTVKNSDQKDQNANGIGDACEFDTDKDGVPDGVDNCIHTPNPDQKDSDGDGIGDTCDRCQLFDPDQLDLDRNGIGDVCDDHEKYIKTHDSDNDGILDAQDNAPKIANPDQKDSDSDTIGDVADNCLLIKNPDQIDTNKNKIGDACEDSDADGIDGWRDNCPTLSNPDQKDTNNDGVGDMCEDTDHDSIYNAQDNCPIIYNKDQKDTDKDGKWNICDDKDDRLIESNRNIFIAIFLVICLSFIAWIVYFVRKIKL